MTGGFRVKQSRAEVRQASAHSLGHLTQPRIRGRLKRLGRLLHRRDGAAEFVQRRFETTEKRRDGRHGLRIARGASNCLSGSYEIATAVIELVVGIAWNRRTAEHR